MTDTNQVQRPESAPPGAETKFGLKPHEDVKTWWGARAIYDGPKGGFRFDLVWDRQQYTGTDQEELKKLRNWIDSVGLKELRKLVKLEGLDNNERRLVSFDDTRAGYFIMANPNRSYGYLYICAAPYSK